MRFFGMHIPKKQPETATKQEPKVPVYDMSPKGKLIPQPTAYFSQNTEHLAPVTFGGEKTPYSLGATYNWDIDYYTLRARTWEAYLRSDVVQNAIRKYCLWIVGAGLKIQSNVKDDILRKFNINLTDSQVKNLKKDIESQFRLFADMSQSTYSGEESLHTQAAEALKNAIMAGDVLCITRYDGKYVNMQIIDGYYVQSPIMGDYQKQAFDRGNRIEKGVEIDKKGRHVAYYVKQPDFTYKRVLAYGSKTKRRQAWLMYGLKHKIKDTRGMSLFTAVIETFNKMNRYRDATLTSAEENAKIVYTVERDADASEENPFAKQIQQSFGKDKGTAPETESQNTSEGAASKVAQTTSGTALNMPAGNTLKRHAGSTDSKFADYFKANIEIVYSTLGIPPEVAMDKYEQNYSSSRAALKSWEYKMMVDRKNILHKQFYKPFFDFWMDIQVMDNMLNAEGYLQALEDRNYMILEAYRSCRFIGAGVPHIDPLKEVNAERRKLGKDFENVPLTDFDQAMENLNTGEFDNMIKKVKDEKQKAEELTGSAGDNNNNASGGAS